jgi:hypothetical protein
MMMRPQLHAVNFASDGRNGTKDLRNKQFEQNRLLRSYKSIAEVHSFGLDDLYGPIGAANAYTLSNPRGAGYWLWKPWLILRVLHAIPQGDIVVYFDSDISVNDDPVEFASECERNGISAIESGFMSNTFTKRDCYIILRADSKEYYDAPQVWAACLAFQNTPLIANFITDWLAACCNPHLIDDSPSVLGPEVTGFMTHRHDQAILTIMLKQAGFRLLPNERATIFAHPPF